MKPHMTWKTARQALTKRWWFLVLCAVIAAGAAVVFAHRQKPHYVVSQSIQEIPGLRLGFATTAQYVNFKTLTLDSGRHTWSVADWSDPAIAKKVVGGSGINPPRSCRS